MKPLQVLKKIFIAVVILAVAFVALVWLTTFHPAAKQPETVVCPEQTATLQPGQSVKVLTWNVQFMAGKDYTFWFDVPSNDGPDERPSPDAITKTFEEVARVISAENPDVVYLQEVDNGAARTDYEDQLAHLRTLLPDYVCFAQSYYWKTTYVPHPRIHGAVGLTLVTLSKYKIASAMRYQLELTPADPLTQQLALKRAILESYMPVNGAKDFIALNTHLDAFAQGSNTMEKQVQQVDERLNDLNSKGLAWVIGGDFNLLPPDDASIQRLTAGHGAYYNPQSEIKLLYDHYAVIPSFADATGPDFANWFTYLPNDPAIPMLDRTLDYLFYASNLTLADGYVRQEDTQKISDHMPVIGVFQLP